MLFNSTDFFAFFGVFLLAWYLVRGDLGARNWLIVFASYIFYAWWDYRFTALLLWSSVVDYAVAIGMGRVQSSSSSFEATPSVPHVDNNDGDRSEDDKSSLRLRRKLLLLVSLVSNLGVLFFFKYFDFFRESMRALLDQFGMQMNWTGLQFILPVGISFYTFQTISYTVDVYRGRVEATRNFGQFLAYVAFFPQLVAGPIERASHLLPQLARKLTITLPMVESGLWLFIWGLFKKVVLADSFGHLVDPVFSYVDPEATQTLIATVAFAFQIYCDFSGYTDMARGMARMLGFDLMLNFNLPYFAISVQDFWRRWHISLSTWLRDYLYVPLGGNRLGVGRTHLNLLVVMLLGGLWHGAAWNFVAWGLWQAVGLMANRLWAERTFARPVRLPGALNWLLTMLFVLYGWLLFRSTSAEQVLVLTASLAHWSPPIWAGAQFRELLFLAAPLVILQLFQWRTGDHEIVLRLPRWARGALQAVLIYVILLFWQREAAPFIYFQF
ncbi:MAG TPA: membrane-bound O-acyltransferase family protein [Verrucomicrobiales bacterium]|nr:membrane-bound O-acyltransferase family protein [Verrucomicrobiales bacterium]